MLSLSEIGAGEEESDSLPIRFGDGVGGEVKENYAT